MAPKTPRQVHRPISAHCAAGRHSLCHGTVYVFPPRDDGTRIVACECKARTCNHGRRDR